MSEEVKQVSVRVQLLRTSEGFKIAVRCPLCKHDIALSLADILTYIQTVLGVKHENRLGRSCVV